MALSGDGREGKLPSNTLYPYSESITPNAGKVQTETPLPHGCVSMISPTKPIAVYGLKGIYGACSSLHKPFLYLWK